MRHLLVVVMMICGQQVEAVQECATIDIAALPQLCRNRSALIGDAITVYHSATAAAIAPTVDVPSRTICFPGSAVDVPSIVTQSAMAAKCDARVAAAAAAAAELAAYVAAVQQSGCDDSLAAIGTRLDGISFLTPAQVRNEFKRIWACVRAARRGL